jgi:DNA-binding transcriptional MerR regulator
LPQDAYTLPELSHELGMNYRTLHSWVERGLFAPSVQQSTGTGNRNLFSARDAVTACVLVELRAAGVKFELLKQAAERLHEAEDTLDRPAYMLVNGDVRIVHDEHEAAGALRRGGLTLAYNTAGALARFQGS